MQVIKDHVIEPYAVLRIDNLAYANLDGAINIPLWIDTSSAIFTPPEPAESISEQVVLPNPKIEETGAEFGYQLVDENGEVINLLSVMGLQADKEYTLEITGKSLVEGFKLESVDLSIDFDTGVGRKFN